MKSTVRIPPLAAVLAALLTLPAMTSAQYEDTGTRGTHFSKKAYSGVAIPRFDAHRAALPAPILQNDPQYVGLYWKAWALAFDHFKRPPAGSPFASDYIDEAFSPSVFQWDTIFMLMFARYGHAVFPAVRSLDNFYSRQYENGYICREIQEADGADFVFVGREHTVNPPLFAWAEVESYRVTGDSSRFAAVFPPLVKYAEWIERHRRTPGTVHGLYWNTGLGSGMDNLPLTGSAWVDMSSQMMLFYGNLSFIAGVIGRESDAQRFRAMADTIGARMNRYLWNEEDGFYYNADDQGRQQRLRSVAGFWPMLAGAADERKARRLLEHLLDPDEFWRAMPFPSLAADEPQYAPDGRYWLGGVWAPTNVMIVKGLERYGRTGGNPTDLGFNEVAAEAAERYLDGLAAVFRKTGTLWENYSPDLMMRGSPSQKDFVGWTGCGPVQLLIENVIGLRPDGARRALTWHLRRIDRHGIERLRFGDVTATLIGQARTSVAAPADLHVVSDRPFTLTVVRPDGSSVTFAVRSGAQRFTVTF